MRLIDKNLEYADKENQTDLLFYLLPTLRRDFTQLITITFMRLLQYVDSEMIQC